MYKKKFVFGYGWYHDDMHKGQIADPLLFSMLSTLVACTLLFSFGLHSVQIAHDHPGHGMHTEEAGNGDHASDVLVLGEYMHLADKKVFALLATIFVLSIVVVRMLYGSWRLFLLFMYVRYTLHIRKRQELTPHIIDYLQFFFSKGILHPKLH